MKAILTIVFMLSLTACGHQQFDCPYKEGARCLSVGEIDKKIDRGEIGQNQTVDKTTKQKSTSSAKKLDFEANSLIPSPLRTPETVLNLWVAPYYTEDGAYHEGRHVHFVSKGASWVGVNPEIVEENP